jgi:hypothetical protein
MVGFIGVTFTESGAGKGVEKGFSIKESSCQGPLESGKAWGASPLTVNETARNEHKIHPRR